MQYMNELIKLRIKKKNEKTHNEGFFSLSDI